MSTYYRDLKEPWSNVIQTTTDQSIHLDLFIDGVASGRIVLDNEKKDNVYAALWGMCGKEVAQISARVDGPTLIYLASSRTDTVVSDYGRITTLTKLVRDYPQGDSYGNQAPTRAAADWLKTP